MLAIFKRELRSCFHGMIGAVLTAFMLASTAIYFVALNLGYGLPDFGYYTLYRTIFVLLLYIPVPTMRSFAEERHSRTDQLLLTSPVSVGGIVLGKYFALCVIFALPCLVDAGMILVLKVLGATGTSTLANFSALLCYYLMGCAAIAIGVFLSSLTENQIIAAVSGVAALLLAYMMPSLRTMFTTGSAVAMVSITPTMTYGVRRNTQPEASGPTIWRPSSFRISRYSCSTPGPRRLCSRARATRTIPDNSGATANSTSACSNAINRLILRLLAK